MNTHAIRSKDGEDGFTLVEVMVAAILAAVFFASLFELNAMCLRYIDSSKESLAALQSVQDRAEALRNRAFSDLTRTDCNPSPPCPTPPALPCCVHDLMATAANPAPIAQRFTEVVTISKYHPPTPPTASEVTQFTRSPDGSVATNSLMTNPTDPALNMVQVDVSVSWTTTVGGRARTEQTTCIVSNGTKK